MVTYEKQKKETDFDTEVLIKKLGNYYNTSNCDVIKSSLKDAFKTKEKIDAVIEYCNYTFEDFVTCLITYYRKDLFNVKVIETIKKNYFSLPTYTNEIDHSTLSALIPYSRLITYSNLSLPNVYISRTDNKDVYIQKEEISEYAKSNNIELISAIVPIVQLKCYHPEIRYRNEIVCLSGEAMFNLKHKAYV